MWLAPVLMAMLAMVLTIAAIVGVGIAFGLTLGAALLLASILAPTDPVLPPTCRSTTSRTATSSSPCCRRVAKT